VNDKETGMTLTNRIFAALAALVFAFFHAGAALAQQDMGPEELVRKVTADVHASIQSDKALQAGDQRKALALAEQKILPHVDFHEATKLAVNRAWSAATPEQREKLVTEFRNMLVRVYSKSLNSYRGQTMNVLPVRLAPGSSEVTVRNQYIKPGQPPVNIDYQMRKTTDGWKIYDISAEGVSLVLTYRAEFEAVTRDSGVEGLIKVIAQKNSAANA
jgi:phospholipid transport system substrate-binding protein